MKKIASLTTLIMALASSVGVVHAASTTANLAVSVTVTASCNLSTNALAFGTYASGQNSDVDAATSVSVNCSNGAAYNLALNAGSNSNGNYRMKDGSNNYINYNLYSDSGRTNSLYNGAAKISGTGNGNAQTLSVYGRIPAGQTTAAGSYSDTVVGTLTY